MYSLYLKWTNKVLYKKLWKFFKSTIFLFLITMSQKHENLLSSSWWRLNNIIFKERSWSKVNRRGKRTLTTIAREYNLDQDVFFFMKSNVFHFFCENHLLVHSYNKKVNWREKIAESHSRRIEIENIMHNRIPLCVYNFEW